MTETSLVHKAQAIPTGSLARHFSDEAKAIVAVMPPGRIVAEIAATPGRIARAFVLSLVPLEKLPAVLLKDTGVFDPNLRMRRGEVPHCVTRITRDEHDEIKRRIGKNPAAKAVFAAHLVELEYDPMGRPIAFGLRSFLEDMSPDEALERLDAVLESDNDDAWKRAALKAVPIEYWGIAVWSLKDEEITHRADAIERLLNISNFLQIISDAEETLFLRVMEAREERLPEFEETIEVGEEAAAAQAAMSAAPAKKMSALDMLAAIRDGKQG